MRWIPFLCMSQNTSLLNEGARGEWAQENDHAGMVVCDKSADANKIWK
jgi:hypothetical protein